MPLIAADKVPIASAAGRTSLLVNLTGIFVQKLQPKSEAGVPVTKLQKVLANVIWDWFTLAKHYDRFRFSVPGDLAWLPDLSGALAHLLPTTDYRAKMWFDCYHNLVDLTDSGVFKVFARTSGYEEAGERHIVFAPYAEEEVVRYNNVEPHEERYWTVLSTIYGTALHNDPDALDIMASSRTSQSTILCALRHFLEWHEGLLTCLVALGKDTGASAPRDNATGIANAGEAARKYALCLDHYVGRAESFGVIQRFAKDTELEGLVPAVVLPANDELHHLRLKALRDNTVLIFAVQALCAELLNVFNGSGADLNRVDYAARSLETFQRLGEEHRQPMYWQKTFAEPPNSEAARACSELLRSAVTHINEDAQTTMAATNDFYAGVSNMLHPLYPHKRPPLRPTVPRILPKR
ncbi:MAG TPA: hypothetical protein VHX14_09080 [Thermoanaerobaculia bacterium]|jgi:hypothetical protein|nr:hypothetical protein [Thermoanaerobaculia bacterium]